MTGTSSPNVKDEVVAIKVKTDKLPSDPASESKQDTAIGFVDPDVAMIKAKTELIPAGIATQLAAIDAKTANLPDNPAPSTYLTGDAYVRLGAPAGASIAADIAAEFARLGIPAGASIAADIAAVFARLGAPAGASISADIAAIKALVTGDAYVRLGAPAGASISADIAAIKALVTGDAYIRLGAPAGASIAADIATKQATLTRPLGLIPSDTVLLTNATERSTSSISYVKLKEIIISIPGVIRTYFEAKSSSGSYYASFKIYKNGAAVGTERVTNSTTYVAYTEDLPFTHGDLYQIYAMAGGGGSLAYVQNQNVNGAEGVGVATSGY